MHNDFRPFEKLQEACCMTSLYRLWKLNLGLHSNLETSPEITDIDIMEAAMLQRIAGRR